MNGVCDSMCVGVGCKQRPVPLYRPLCLIDKTALPFTMWCLCNTCVLQYMLCLSRTAVVSKCWTDHADFSHRGYPLCVLHRISREIGYHQKSKITFLRNLVQNSEFTGFFCCFTAARRPSWVLSTLCDRHKFVTEQPPLFTTHARDTKHCAVCLRQLRLVTASTYICCWGSLTLCPLNPIFLAILN